MRLAMNLLISFKEKIAMKKSMSSKDKRLTGTQKAEDRKRTVYWSEIRFP